MKKKSDDRQGLNDLPTRSPERAISKSSVRDKRIKKILAILRKVDAQPRNWVTGKSAWIKHVAIKYDISVQSVYRWRLRYNERGIAGLEHCKSSCGLPKVWAKEALSFWLGLCLQPPRRALTLQVLYEELILEAKLRGWHVGSWASAKWWLTKKSKMLMEI